MELLIPIIGAVMFYILIKWWNDRRSNDDAGVEETAVRTNESADSAVAMDGHQQTDDDGAEKAADDAADDVCRVTRAVAEEALRRLNCQCIEDKNDNMQISFQYQSEHFFINFNDTNCFVCLTDPNWYEFRADDIDNLAKVKDVVNDLNWYHAVNVVYTHDEKAGVFNIHSRCHLVAVKEMMLDTPYLQNALSEFFVTHHQFYRLMADKN